MFRHLACRMLTKTKGQMPSLRVPASVACIVVVLTLLEGCILTTSVVAALRGSQASLSPDAHVRGHDGGQHADTHAEDSDGPDEDAPHVSSATAKTRVLQREELGHGDHDHQLPSARL